MNHVGMRSGTALWWCAVIAASLLATTALAAGAKHKSKGRAPKAVGPDSGLKVMPPRQSITTEELKRIPVDEVMESPVFPPRGQDTRDAVERLRLLNTQKPGTLTVCPYPSPVPDGSKLVFRGGRGSGDVIFQLDGKDVVPAPTRPDTAWPVPRAKLKPKGATPKPH